MPPFAPFETPVVPLPPASSPPPASPAASVPPLPVAAASAATYVELHAHSAFSLLDGGSPPEALVARAAAIGLGGLALTDHDDLGGAVRFAQAAAARDLPALIGVELTVRADAVDPEEAWDGRPGLSHLVLLAETGAGYANLAQLVTRARTAAPRGRPSVTLAEVARHAAGVTALTGCPAGAVPAALARGDRRGAEQGLGQLRDIFGTHLAVECWDHALEEERLLTTELTRLARWAGLPWVVTNDVHYATARTRVTADVLAALRHGRTLDAMGPRLRPNAEWRLKSPDEMAARWGAAAPGLRTTVAIRERCVFRLGDLRPTLPAFPLPAGVSADDYLAAIVWQGVTERWGPSPTDRQRQQITHELAIVRRLGLAGYFLIVWDIVRFARREGILCQGRGSAANSAVCYCLGITAVDPVRMELLFERFLSDERQDAPDIDIDFAHRDRERVLQYVYARYGRDHAAMVCEQICFRARSATRDVARVLGFSPEQADQLADVADALGPAAERAQGPDAATTTRLTEVLTAAGVDPADRRVRMLAPLVAGLEDLPRHRSIHVGGFVLTREPLASVVPIEPAAMDGRTIIQWEKDDLDPVGLVKIDLLALGILTVIQECIASVRRTRGVTVDLAQLNGQDPAVFDMICRADTVGVFQIESRAQMNLLPRLQPRTFYDLVVCVALIRPGPIQGDMVHPYLRRRAGTEPVVYPHPSLEPILARTLGIPLFQEQGMQVAITAAGFTPGQADVLRRAMGNKRSRERMAAIGQELIAGMARNGIPEATATRIYEQIHAFADYGFPESHAASFALLVYASAYLKHYFPAEYLAAMLNAQPMGFYAPGTLVEDARRHGVEVRPPDLARSAWDSGFEVPTAAPDAGPAVRLGLRVVHGLGARAGAGLQAALATGPFVSIADVVARSGLDRRALRCLAEAGAFDAFLPEEGDPRRRRAALWQVLEERQGRAGPLIPVTAPTAAPVPGMSAVELTAADYRMTGLSVGGHPMRHLRAPLARRDVLPADALASRPDGARVAVAGLVIVRQRPGTAKGFVFLTLEDETGTINVVVTPTRFARWREVITGAPLLLVRGVLQVERGVVNVRGEAFEALTANAGEAHAGRHDFH